MEEELLFIQYQLWGLIGLFVIFMAANIACNLAKKQNNEPVSEADHYPELWDGNKLDELIERSTQHLEKYPNSVNALYFGAKALIVKGRYTEAKERVAHIEKVEPRMKETVIEILQEIEDAENS